MDDIVKSRGNSMEMIYQKIKWNLNAAFQAPLTFTDVDSAVSFKKEWMSKTIQRKEEPSTTFGTAM